MVLFRWLDTGEIGLFDIFCHIKQNMEKIGRSIYANFRIIWGFLFWYPEPKGPKKKSSFSLILSHIQGGYGESINTSP